MCRVGVGGRCRERGECAGEGWVGGGRVVGTLGGREGGGRVVGTLGGREVSVQGEGVGVEVERLG